MRIVLAAPVLAAALLLAIASGAEAQRAAKPLNPASDKLEKLPAPERAGVLARAVGHWCIGTETFLMGVVTQGQGAGNAYWSLRCADVSTWVMQIDRLAGITAIDC